MSTESTLLTFRDMVLNIVPRWLRKGSLGPGIAGKLLYAFGVQLDALGDAAVAGVKRGYPGLSATSDAYPLIGAQRRIARGPFEVNAGYAARLRGWLDAHATRGGPYAMLHQLYGFWGGAWPIALVNRTGKRFTLNTDGTITRDTVVGWTDTDVNGLGVPLQQWRLFFQWPTAVGNDGLWGSAGSSGDGHWGDGGLWGVDLLPVVVQNILLVPTDWNAAHTGGFVYLVAPADWPNPLTWRANALAAIPVN